MDSTINNIVLFWCAIIAALTQTPFFIAGLVLCYKNSVPHKIGLGLRISFLSNFAIGISYTIVTIRSAMNPINPCISIGITTGFAFNTLNIVIFAICTRFHKWLISNHLTLLDVPIIEWTKKYRIRQAIWV